MLKIIFVFYAFLLFNLDLAMSENDLDQDKADIYYEMTSKVDDLSDNNNNAQSNEQIRMTGDKYGLTYQESMDLYQEGRSMELDDE